MPKLLDYPRASFKMSLELAKAVESLGGKCTPESAAQKMGKKVTGTFKGQIGAAVKFGLITSGGGQLAVTPLHKSIKLAYDDKEKNEILKGAFLTPTVFRDLANRFDGNSLPVEMLGKLLAREFGVDSVAATTVANYFIDGAKSVGLLDGSGVIRQNAAAPADENSDDEDVIHTREVAPLEVLPPSESNRYEPNRRRDNGEEMHTHYTPVEVPSDDRRKIQIPLPQKRMAELIVPDEMTIKDLDIIRMQLEVLRVFIENS
ncbi:hypothetical protein [Hymenobacter terrigena]